MTTTLSQQSQQQDTPPAALPDLSALSTLWVPLHEVRQAWATFGSEYIEARQHKRQQWEQQGSQYRTGPLAEIREQEG